VMSMWTEEKELLEAIYPNEFVVCGDAEWQVMLTELEVCIHVTLPADYPASQPPVMSIQSCGSPLPASFLQETSKKLASEFNPGESCVYQMIESAKEALQNATEAERTDDTAHKVASEPVDEPDREHLTAAQDSLKSGDFKSAVEESLAVLYGCPSCFDAHAVAGFAYLQLGEQQKAYKHLSSVYSQQNQDSVLAKKCMKSVRWQVNKFVGPSLLEAGFEACGEASFAQYGLGITVELEPRVFAVVDGIDTEDLEDYVSIQLEDDLTGFGAKLIQWAKAQRSQEPGFDAEDSSTDLDAVNSLDYLPTPGDLKVTPGRALLIYTWGKALRKSAPADSQHNFNAGILNGRGGGADLRTMNGLSDEVQSNVASCSLFPTWISMVVAKVEHSQLNAISINCTKGRHRSVAAAEILKRIYYPEATVKHLTIY